MLRFKKILVLSLLVCLAVVPHYAQAISIPLGDSGWAMVINSDVSEVGEVCAPYVFGIFNGAVIIEIDKTFEKAPNEFGVFDPIVIEFEKISENAVSTIIINDEYIINDTGVEWTDFHMHLMVDADQSGNPEAGFDSQYYPDGGQLEDVSYDNYYGYQGMATDLNFVNSYGGGVLSDPSGDDVFRPGYLAGGIVIVIDPTLEVGERFGLKETPTTIPEPASIAILTLGLLPIVLKKRK